jgi:pimeloyl-ACP methyl ester carboxylesterase
VEATLAWRANGGTLEVMETATATSETTIRSGDAEIVTQAFGVPTNPPVLMIMGQMASMLWWPDELCERLADAGRYVIRYDNRDTGRSTAYQPGNPPYTGDDLAADAIAVLDGYGISRAHLVGMSMGGAVAQVVTLAHPERVATLTAISTTRVGASDSDAGLPGPNREYMEHAAAAESLDWSDTEAVAEFLVRDARALAGTSHPFDEAAAHNLVARDLERTVRPASLVNHSLLSDDNGDGGRHGELAPPLLVIHGTADPLFPYEHGVALAGAVPAADLVTIEGGGHELHEDDWPQILDAIVAHTATH